MVSENAGHRHRWQQDFLETHQLDNAYLETATTWFEPLVASIAMHQKSASRPLVVGVNGTQGSGKSTLCDYLCQSLEHTHQCTAVAMSLDDFYLTRAERQSLARDVHPLFVTRGVPGTHDYPFLRRVLTALQSAGQGAGPGAGPGDEVRLPVFDKLRDDRAPEQQWIRVNSPVEVIILEGWCLGATAQDKAELATDANALEAVEDTGCRWREYVNTALQHDLSPLYPMIDLWVMLQAPSFDCVFAWRQEQEKKLAAKAGSDPKIDAEQSAMDEQDLRRFLAHFERLTDHCLAELPGKVHHLFTLDASRQVAAYEHNDEPNPFC